MKGHGEKFSRKKEIAVSALLIESSLAAAANRAGISESTLRRWLRDQEFAAAVDDARRATFRDAIGSLRVATIQAVETLRSALNDPSSSIRVRAAVAILELGAELGEIGDLSSRLSRLEQNENRQSS
jgi:transposase-like protein